MTGPEMPEPGPMPADHRRGLDDRQGLLPARPALREDDPEAAVPHPEARTSVSEGPREHPDLLPESQILEREFALGLER
jgi:hypothetical protein